MRSEELVGQTIGHYRLLRPLGYGGTATVFLAQDVHLQREVAIKVFEPGSGDAQAFLRRFAREARVLAQLDHPNILPVYDYGEQDDIAYLVMPYMAGGSLKDYLQQRGPVPAAETVKLIGQILHALQYAHDKKLIHRDIKPGNMLFKADGTLVLSDFGLVKILQASDSTLPINDSGNASQHIILGTPDFMAPEQISGQATMTSDIYSVGVVLYEMLTGQALFKAENRMGIFMKHLYEKPRPLRALNSHISPELEAVVLRALAKDPAARYQQPNELLQALMRAVSAADATQAGTSTVTHSMTTPPLSAERDPAAPVARVTPPELPTNAHEYGKQAMPPEALTPYSPLREQWLRTQEAGPFMPGSGGGHVPPQAPPGRRPAPAPRSSAPIILALILVVLLLIGTVAGILYAEGVFFPSKPSGTPTPAASATTPANTATTGAQFTLACPSPGAAHKAYIPNRRLGNTKNIIYIDNSGAADNSSSSTIFRRNIADTASSEIRAMPGSSVTQAQVSQDGLSVLFVAKVSSTSEIRMIGTDGTYLQTLYCAPQGETISGIQWSFDQKYIIFSVGPDNPALYLLQPSTGQVQTVLTSQTNTIYQIRAWLTNTQVYLVKVHPSSDAPPDNIYLLDVTKGANQHDDSLKEVYTGALTCMDFDASYKGDQLIRSACNGPIPPSGPSTISMSVGTTGAGTQTVIKEDTMAIVSVRSVTEKTLLFIVNNTTSGNADDNGLWRVDLDGTGLKHLAPDPQGMLSFCPSSQASWANVTPVSWGKQSYALQTFDNVTNSYSIYYAPLDGGDLHEVARFNDGSQLALAGWARL